MTIQIKTSKHSTKFANSGKNVALSTFLNDYRTAVEFYIDHFWVNKMSVSDSSRQAIFQNELLQWVLHQLRKYLLKIKHQLVKNRS